MYIWNPRPDSPSGILDFELGIDFGFELGWREEWDRRYPENPEPPAANPSALESASIFAPAASPRAAQQVVVHQSNQHRTQSTAGQNSAPNHASTSQALVGATEGPRGKRKKNRAAARTACARCAKRKRPCERASAGAPCTYVIRITVDYSVFDA